MLERTLIRPTHELPLIHMGFNPDEATLNSTADPLEIIEEGFGKNSPLVLLNFGGSFLLNKSIYEKKGRSIFDHRLDLPAFGIYSFLDEDSRSALIFSTIVGSNDEAKIWYTPMRIL